MSKHRARGYGRYVAFRTAPPRHAADPTSRKPVLVVAAVAGSVSLGLIAAAATATPPREIAAAAGPPPEPVAVPAPYEPEHPTANAIKQRAKERPQILLGTPGATELTAYCLTTATGALSQAVADGTDWTCRPLLGEPVPITMNQACRSVYAADDAYAKKEQVWRCFRDGP